MINKQSLPEHKYNSSVHSCRNCYNWEHCTLGKNRPNTLRGDYGLYGCFGHQLNKNHDEKDKE